MHFPTSLQQARLYIYVLTVLYDRPIRKPHRNPLNGRPRHFRLGLLGATHPCSSRGISPSSKCPYSVTAVHFITLSLAVVGTAVIDRSSTETDVHRHALSSLLHLSYAVHRVHVLAEQSTRLTVPVTGAAPDLLFKIGVNG